MANATMRAKDDEAQSTQEVTQEDGSGAPCTVCYRAFTLMKTGLVRVHGPVGN